MQHETVQSAIGPVTLPAPTTRTRTQTLDVSLAPPARAHTRPGHNHGHNLPPQVRGIPHNLRYEYSHTCSPSPLPASTEGEGKKWWKPKPWQVLGGLVVLFFVDLVGMIIFMTKVKNIDQGLRTVVSALLILILVYTFGFIFRQAILLNNRLRPDLTLGECSLPTWLVGLPTYRDVLRSDGQHHVHGGSRRGGEAGDWKGGLPVYGDTRGSELLMKSAMSREDGVVEEHQLPSITVVRQA